MTKEQIEKITTMIKCKKAYAKAALAAGHACEELPEWNESGSDCIIICDDLIYWNGFLAGVKKGRR